MKMGRALRAEAVPAVSDTRTSLSNAGLKQEVLDDLLYSIGRVPAVAPDHAYYKALALAVRDRLQHHWSNTIQAYFSHVSSKKIACYFSAEFLMGPQLGSSLVNLGIEQAVRTAVAELGKDLDDLIALEEEPGLGNGGLGGLPPVISIHLRRSRFQRLVTESATNSVFLTRRFMTAGKWKLRTNGYVTVIPGSWPFLI